MINLFTNLSRRVFESRFLRAGFFLSFIQVISGILGYVYQILMGRMLSPVEFASLSSIMALIMFLSSPMVALSMIVVRKVSDLRAHNYLHNIKSFFFQINKILIFPIGTMVIIFFVTIPYIQHYLKIENLLPIFLLIFILIANIFNAVFIAFFQGMQKFIWLGILGLLVAVGKILISTIFILLGFGIEGPLLGMLCTMIIVFGIGMPIMFRSLPLQMPYQYFKINMQGFKSSLPVLIATISFAAFTQLDMVLVNYYFSSEDAGLYAAASVLGKAVLYLPGGLILALFPIAAESKAKGESSIRIFSQAIGSTIFFSGLIAIFYWIFSNQLISIFYGDNYQGAGDILRWYGFAILPLTLVIITEHYLIAHGQVLFAWLFLLMLPFMLLMVSLWHTEIWMILLIICCFGLILLLIGCYLILRSGNFNFLKN